MPASYTEREIATRLESAITPALVFGTNLFIGKQPDEPSFCVTLYLYQGNESEQGFGVAGVQYEHPRIQARVRHEDQITCRDVAEQIYRNLTEVQAASLGSTFYQMIRAISTPLPLNMDERKRFQYVVNFQCDKEPSA